MRGTFKPVDLLSLAFIALLTFVTIAAYARLPHAGWLLARYAALVLALALVALAAARQQASSFARTIHAFLPVLVVPVIFDSMGDLIPWVRSRTVDDLLISIDFRLFGGHHPTLLFERFIHPLLTTVLQFAYISYYPMAITLGAVLYRKKNKTAFGEAIFGIILCFYLSYAGYLLFPAIGPRFTLAHLQTSDLAASPLVVAIQETLNALENTKTDAFPSGHTAIALMTLYYAAKFRERSLTALLIPAVTGLIISTVYLRYHYVIDVIAGIALTAMTIYLAPPLSRRLLRASGRAGDQFHDPA
ncbi:MAG: phosphatase PAP2 family protein [Nitrospirota bacterium]